MPVPVLAFSTQKGGVAKTTSAVSVAACLAEAGHRVLVIDLDAQASACLSLGLPPIGDADIGIDEVLLNRRPLTEAMRPTVVERVSCVYAPTFGTSSVLGREISGHMRLKIALDPCPAVDYVVVDCPTGMGPLTLAGVVAATHLVIPLIPDFLGLQALRDQMALLEQVREGHPPGPKIIGILPTMVERRALCSQVLKVLADSHAGLLLPPVRRAVAAPEAAARRRPLTMDAPSSPITEDYRATTKTIIDRIL